MHGWRDSNLTALDMHAVVELRVLFVLQNYADLLHVIHPAENPPMEFGQFLRDSLSHVTQKYISACYLDRLDVRGLIDF
jgi:hypothetical protein